MKWFGALLAVSCAAPQDNPCADGFGEDDKGRCVPLDISLDAPDEDPAVDTGGEPAFNTPPTAPGVGVVPPNPRAGGAPLTCVVANESVDLDGDPVVYAFSWSSDSGDAIDGPLVESARLTEGTQWTCTVIPSDEEESGPANTADVVIGPEPMPWLGPQASLSSSDYLFLGEFPGDGAGAPISSAGDVDGDGRDDILVGAYWNDQAGNSAGKAYLIFGGSLGATRQVSLSEANWHFLGERGGGEPPCGDSVDDIEGVMEDELCDGDWAGHSLNKAGDVDGDGLGDILISAYRSDDVDIEAGKITLIPGRNLGADGGQMSLSDGPVQFMGESAFDFLGHGVASIGDLDGDGLDDLVFGSYGADDLAGRGYVVLGSSIADEMTMDVGEADFIFTGEQPQDEAGLITSSAGDVDGDGLDDFVIAAMYNKEVGDADTPIGRSGSGKVYVVTASGMPGRDSTSALADVDRAWLAEGDGDALACATSPVGDVDGDGLDDVIMGAYGNDSGGDSSGKVYVATGADMALPATQSVSMASYGFTGEGSNEWAGFSSGPAGDVDMDGKADIMIGAFRYTVHSERKMDAGKAYLVRMGLLDGPGTYTLGDAHASWVGEYEGDEAGYKATSAGDVNGDGLPDIMVSGWQLNVPSGGGKVWVLLNP